MPDWLKSVDQPVYEAITRELKRQREHIELIASENFTHPAVLEAQGSVLTNKYAEGYPRARWYGGCEYVDQAEDLAIERVKKLFGAEYANVQPHSGTQANMAVMMTVLEAGDTILALDLACGGHLSHGHPLNFSGKFYKVIAYGVNKKTEMLDYDEIEQLALKNKPKLIVAGASAYPRTIDFKAFRAIADKVGAYLLVDMAHFAGLVAAKIHPNPCEYADFVTSTTHKTLRGPRGGFILARNEFSKKINTSVFPGIQGGPLMHVIAAKAVAFGLALEGSFIEYQKQVVANAAYFADCLQKKGYRVVSGGTDTHLFLLDLSPKAISGKEATAVLGKVNITVNKNLIPFDSKPPAVASGIRIGTPAVTTRGMKIIEMEKISDYIDLALSNKDNPKELESLLSKVSELTKGFPLYPQL
ncbi:MAG: serine hydroxymethyltransferase [Candidatus Omnitrophica bacterium]|nr:serine hydroxymethyltransferase [Candidatus Omnitrophota bacterium]MBU2044767.1 serine hydroxymethyltransferase [Candidatus Omnitrophota bacterium]MBU2251289.1 serine hydroxymethyltransferase [Candidatus Omnitrophota bacterium]MBU2473983.1 serine hydroxymethyltransferase [Candidatus Omnitrophota bacterium]